MKGIRFARNAAAIATLLLACGLISSSAQDNGSAPPANQRGGHMMPTAEQRTDHLASALNLSDDQRAKALSIYQDEDKQMSALRSDSSTSREDRHAKMQQIHENTVSQIKGILNADQAKKFDEMQQNMGRHRRGQNQDAAPPQQ
jgi:Spy/CpxP family protein refolding chaperone